MQPVVGKFEYQKKFDVNVSKQMSSLHSSHTVCVDLCVLHSFHNKLDPVPGWTCAQEAFPVVLSLMAY